MKTVSTSMKYFPRQWECRHSPGLVDPSLAGLLLLSTFQLRHFLLELDLLLHGFCKRSQHLILEFPNLFINTSLDVALFLLKGCIFLLERLVFGA